MTAPHLAALPPSHCGAVCLAFAQQVKCSQCCPLGVGNLPAGNHTECVTGCVAAGTSCRCKWIPQTGLSLRSGHFRAFFSWLLVTLFSVLPVIFFFKVTYGNDLRSAAQSKLVLHWGPFHTAICPADMQQDRSQLPRTIFQGPEWFLAHGRGHDGVRAGSSSAVFQTVRFLITSVPCFVPLLPFMWQNYRCWYQIYLCCNSSRGSDYLALLGTVWQVCFFSPCMQVYWSVTLKAVRFVQSTLEFGLEPRSPQIVYC